MTARSTSPRSAELRPPRDEHWTLHHALLYRIERGEDDEDATERAPHRVYRAFEAVDAGNAHFTADELGAMQEVLAAYHHRKWWEVERPRVESLLRQVTDALEELPPAESGESRR